MSELNKRKFSCSDHCKGLWQDSELVYRLLFLSDFGTVFGTRSGSVQNWILLNGKYWKIIDFELVRIGISLLVGMTLKSRIITFHKKFIFRHFGRFLSGHSCAILRWQPPSVGIASRYAHFINETYNYLWHENKRWVSELMY